MLPVLLVKPVLPVPPVPPALYIIFLSGIAELDNLLSTESLQHKMWRAATHFSSHLTSVSRKTSMLAPQSCPAFRGFEGP